MPKGHYDRGPAKFTKQRTVSFTEEQDSRLGRFMDMLRAELPGFTYTQLIRTAVMRLIGLPDSGSAGKPSALENILIKTRLKFLEKERDG